MTEDEANIQEICNQLEDLAFYLCDADGIQWKEIHIIRSEDNEFHVERHHLPYNPIGAVTSISGTFTPLSPKTEEKNNEITTDNDDNS